MASRKSKVVREWQACRRMVAIASGSLLPGVSTMLFKGTKNIRHNHADVEKALNRVAKECFRTGARAGKASAKRR